MKTVPGASWVPSGIVTSLMKVALSQVVPGITPLWVGDGLGVLSSVGLGEGVGVDVGEGVGVWVSVAVGSSTIAIAASTV